MVKAAIAMALIAFGTAAAGHFIVAKRVNQIREAVHGRIEIQNQRLKMLEQTSENNAHLIEGLMKQLADDDN